MSSELFEEYQLSSGISLPNRFIMGSMHLGWEEFPGGDQILSDFYKERAKGGVGMIITGGIAPSEEGSVMKGGAVFNSQDQIPWHRNITSALAGLPTKICLQILHTGRYALNPENVGPSPIQAPINPFTPKELTDAEIEKLIDDFVNTALLAQEAGYDGVEIMGSEGYLLNQFSVPRTNHRKDQWGGSIENRARLSMEIVRRIRAVVDERFIIVFRLSMLDLVEGGNSWEEVVFQARALEKLGVDLLNTGIGWHEARIPTIAGVVPESGFLWVTEKMKQEVDLPVIATNRFNQFHHAEAAVLSNKADFISMARPFLADSRIVEKYRTGHHSRVNTCIACNQACLDHVFQAKPASCLVNPKAGIPQRNKSEKKTVSPKKVVVVGAGPAGLSCAFYASQLGHDVELIEKNEVLGGQFVLASQVPGKSVYKETVRYFQQGLEENGVKIHLNTSFDIKDIKEGTDALVWAAGVAPRFPDIPGLDSSTVKTYEQVLRGEGADARKIAIIGGGGIAVDVAHYLYHNSNKEEDFFDFWGIDRELKHRGGLQLPVRTIPNIEVSIFKRSKGKIGGSLGKTTAWIHRLYLKEKGLKIVEGVQYHAVQDSTLHYEKEGTQHAEEFNLIVLCAGQESIKMKETLPSHVSLFEIGGSRNAGELDAQRAIEEAYQLALRL